MLPDADVLHNEIHMLHVKILELHTRAWKSRMSGNIASMREIHRVIRLYHKRITDCQWAIEYVRVSL